jgi:hypothetical protein
MRHREPTGAATHTRDAPARGELAGFSFPIYEFSFSNLSHNSKLNTVPGSVPGGIK